MANRISAKEFAADHNSGKYTDRELMRKYKIANKFGLYSRRAYCKRKGLIPVIDKSVVRNTNVNVKTLPDFKTITFPNGFVIAVSNTANKKMVINEKQIILVN